MWHRVRHMARQLMMRVTMAWEVAMTRLMPPTTAANTIPRMRVALVEETDNVRDDCLYCVSIIIPNTINSQ